MAYRVAISKKAIKQLVKLPTSDYVAIKKTIYTLAETPRPHGCKKLRGRPGYRIRQGNYRIIYEIFEQRLRVEIIAVGHRKSIYLN